MAERLRLSLCRPLQRPRVSLSLQHFIVTAIVAAAFFMPAARAQSAPNEPAPNALLPIEENQESNVRAEASASYLKSESPRERIISAGNFQKRQFVVLSAAVYAASLADMHETIRVRNEAWWYERDPLARPIVRLPAPAYYASGLALATGVNWLSWKMGHSRRWRKLAFMPQVMSIAGNSYGFKSNH